MTLEVAGVSVRYGTTVAVSDVSLSVGPSERIAILGASGSGKSTLLRAIAGLEPLAAGRITWQGADLAGVPVHARQFGLMFQDYVLFPQRDVRGNVAFGLEMRGDDRPAIEERVADVLRLVGLQGYERRRIDELSGGEQQRVALARALAPTPRLLMLDEPLGALDRLLRTRLLDELVAIFAALELPILYVTHDQEEALAVADRVAILDAGRLVALDEPLELWRNPPSESVARFLGFNNISEYARAADGRAGTAWGDVPLPAAAPTHGKLLIRPDSLSLAADGPIRGTVSAATFRGDHVRVVVATQPSGAPLEIDLRSAAVPRVGDAVAVGVAADGVQVLG